VVGHAGAGFVTSCLREGRRPLVLPRLGRYAEHVDDHQRQLAAKLAQLGLLVPLEDRIDMRHVRAAETPIRMPDWPAATPTVGEAIRTFLRSARAGDIASRAS